MSVPTHAVPLYISVNDACSRWGCSRGYLYELLATGKLTARKLGSRTRLEIAAGDAFFSSLPKAEIRPQRKPKADASPVEGV